MQPEPVTLDQLITAALEAGKATRTVETAAAAHQQAVAALTWLQQTHTEQQAATAAAAERSGDRIEQLHRLGRIVAAAAKLGDAELTQILEWWGGTESAEFLAVGTLARRLATSNLIPGAQSVDERARLLGHMVMALLDIPEGQTGNDWTGRILNMWHLPAKTDDLETARTELLTQLFNSWRPPARPVAQVPDLGLSTQETAAMSDMIDRVVDRRFPDTVRKVATVVQLPPEQPAKRHQKHDSTGYCDEDGNVYDAELGGNVIGRWSDDPAEPPAAEPAPADRPHLSDEDVAHADQWVSSRCSHGKHAICKAAGCTCTCHGGTQ